jgi:uncharacterized membrane protein YphA (DoxX/SURF4 family)
MVPRSRYEPHGNWLLCSNREVLEAHPLVWGSRKVSTPKVLAKDAANWGFVRAAAFLTWGLGRLWDAREGMALLQRLFSTFPHGRPGMGLLLLRAAIGITGVVEGVLCLPTVSGVSTSSYGQWLFCFVLILGGAALVIGCLAPVAALATGTCFFLTSLGWVPEPVGGLHEARLAGLRIVVAAVSLALLGPGAFSLDAYLFGRREIVIPPSVPRPQP